MDPEDNGFSHSWNWKPNNFNHHPFTYDWAKVVQDQWQNGEQPQQDLEWEMAYLELIDYVVEKMPSTPDADEIFEHIKNLND